MTVLNLKLKIVDRILIKLGLFILTFIILVGIYIGIFWGKIFFNVSINNINVSRLNKQEALDTLKQNTDLNEVLVFSYGEKQHYITSDEISLKIDFEKTINKAINVGRDEDFIGDFLTQIKTFREGAKLNLEVNYDENELARKVASISAEVNEPVIEHEVFLSTENGQKQATVSAAKSGKVVDEEKLKEEIVNSYKNQYFGLKSLPIIIEDKSASDENKEHILGLANNLINKKLKLSLEDNLWEISDEEIVNFLSVYDTYDNSEIVSWVNELANTIDREPEDALFEFDGSVVTEFKPAKNGVKLIKGDTVRDIRNGIDNLSKSEEQEYEVKLAVYEAEPEVKTGDVNDLGIKERIGYGESWFGHSIATRIDNLELASLKMHGVLVAPGEEFSVLENVAPIDQAHGYKSAYIIQNGRTILGDGGGVCQTSTTMFRAALSAGLPIIERHPHAYRVGYYEQNYDVGIDASVFEPTADFRFLNDTPAHILVQVHIDRPNYYLRYDLYGTNDGRVSEVIKPTIWSTSPPLPDVYQDDPSLPVGTVKQVDWKAWGAKVSFDWRVTRDGEVLQEETFWSNYRPWAAVFLKGTKE